MVAAMKDNNDIVRRWLFPSSALSTARALSDSYDLSVSWVDADLNAEQRNAIAAVVERDHGIPYLISGPPGVSFIRPLFGRS